jgi:hypothetical protein
MKGIVELGWILGGIVIGGITLINGVFRIIKGWVYKTKQNDV